ncbi:hypothetical protein Gogos_011207 [Gossypium gossypioides]|uniref:60S ribosomal protein L5 n=1 Tax=Gossypium gossypioides TaxID=34282 RepID=A0A7J9BNL9_GOSGO|nr:hypothetical protein [Gossypium gossypioides]
MIEAIEVALSKTISIIEHLSNPVEYFKVLVILDETNAGNNKDVTAQIISANISGGMVLASAYSHELPCYGLEVGLTNYAAAYCTGLLLGHRVLNLLEMDDEYRGRLEATGEDFSVEPTDTRRPFRAVLDWTDQDSNWKPCVIQSDHFISFLLRTVHFCNMIVVRDHFIAEIFMRAINLKKLTYEERKAKLIERLHTLNAAAGADSEDED